MSQHDSQELLSRLLDGLHEDLNLIQKKPYVVEDKDYSETSDNDAVARGFWVNFLKRNYSKIIELFYGQFRTRNECPECKNVSIRYDPFELVSLPIPKKQEGVEMSVSAFYITPNHDIQASKVIFNVCTDHKSSVSVKEALEAYAVKKEDGSTWDDYLLTFSGFSVHGDPIKYTQSIKDVYNKSNNSQYRPRLFLFKKTPEEKIISENPEHVTIYCLMKRKDKHSLSTSYPGFSKVTVATPNTTIKELYKVIFRKFAHFVNVKGITDDEDLMDHESFPLKEVDYDKVFEISKSKKFETGFIFSLKICDEVYPLDSIVTLESIISSAHQDLDYSPENRVLKIELILDPNTGNDSLVGVDYMKKVTGEIEVDIRKVADMKEEDDLTNLTLEKLIRRFSKPEDLDDDNKYRCPSCKKEVNAKRQINIYKVPKYFIVHMKKMKSGWDRYRSSGTDILKIDFPVNNFDITDLVMSKDPIESYNIKKEEFMDDNNKVLLGRELTMYESTGKPLVYNLYGIINHYGSMNFGHYTAYCKNENNWYCYDDSNVTQVREDSIVTDAAYVLFYERAD